MTSYLIKELENKCEKVKRNTPHNVIIISIKNIITVK